MKTVLVAAVTAFAVVYSTLAILNRIEAQRVEAASAAINKLVIENTAAEARTKCLSESYPALVAGFEKFGYTRADAERWVMWSARYKSSPAPDAEGKTAQAAMFLAFLKRCL
jgi:hypothetical protein